MTHPLPHKCYIYKTQGPTTACYSTGSDNTYPLRWPLKMYR